jgi:hypothetical protein
MVVLKAGIYTPTILKTIPCLWTIQLREAHKKAFETSLKEWEVLESNYISEIREEPYFKKQARLKVELTEIKASNCVYEVGQVKELFLDQWEFNAKTPKPNVGEAYSNCWFSSIVLEIEDLQVNQGNRKVYPRWELPPKPEYKRFLYSFHNAVWEMQCMIREVCPSAIWEGFWTDYPQRMGYDDTRVTPTGEFLLGWEISLESGVGYLVELKDSKLVLSKFPIERYHYYPTVGDIGDIGIGSWSDKGYF